MMNVLSLWTSPNRRPKSSLPFAESSGKPKELVRVGVSTDDEEIKALVSKGKLFISKSFSNY